MVSARTRAMEEGRYARRAWCCDMGEPTMTGNSLEQSRVCRAELVGVLSLATDLALGQQQEFGLRAAILATRFGESLGLEPFERSEIFHVALLRWVGCTAHAHELSQWFGDELAARRRFAGQDLASAIAPVWHLMRQVAGRSPLRPPSAGDGRLSARDAAAALQVAGSEVAENYAARLGFGPGVCAALANGFERWDGRGPQGVSGDMIPLATRIVQLAHDAEFFRLPMGVESVVRTVRARTSTTYDPELARRFCDQAAALFDGLDVTPWEQAMQLAPEPSADYAGEQLDDALTVVADFIDLKSPLAAGHSRAVAALVSAAASWCSFDESRVARLRRCGLLHNLGSVSVPNSIWEKPGPLTDGEWEAVRLHPYFTERLLRRAESLTPLAAEAGLHHERADGSGYFRGVSGGQVQLTAQLLIAADMYTAMVEERPHRPALGAAKAEGVLLAEARAGRLDRRAVDAVLAGAGRTVKRRPGPGAAMLSAREIEVLRLLAVGLSDRLIGERLFITERTVGTHVENIYRKIGVRTRAAAALFAVQHGLLGPT